MKKLFSHPRFHAVFPLLGLVGCGLQLWFCAAKPDHHGLLIPGHPATALTLLVLAVAAVLAVLSAPHVQMPRHAPQVRAVGCGMAAAFHLISAIVLFIRGSSITALAAFLCALASAYALWARLRKNRVHFGAYALISLFHLCYLISCYQNWSAEPELPRYCFQLLSQVSIMLLFYQKAALHAHSEKFTPYCLWHSLALVLSLVALPSAPLPTVHLSATIWMLLDATPRARSKTEGSAT